MIACVDRNYKTQYGKLKDQIPERPSLNNYLVAAFLDGTIEFADIDTLKAKMRETVLRFGSHESLIHDEDRWDRREPYVAVKPEDLFVIPQPYLDKLAEYEGIKKEIEAKMEALEATKDTIVMKIQVGSPKVLDRLVEQIDNLGDLDLLNNQLMLVAGKGDQEEG